MERMADAKSKDGASLAWDLPSSRSQSRTADGQRSLEDIMGEAEENKTKMSTDIPCEDDIGDLQALSTMLANFQGRVKILFEVDNKSMDSKTNPWCHDLTRQLLIEITGLDFCRSYISSSESQPQLLYYVFFWRGTCPP